jgi:hypothetical protein
MPQADVPARVHILLARDAPVGVAIRRGPSKRVCTVLWDRERDEFSVGQWMKGRIYERRCDVSPRGKYLIYFAMNGHWESETKGSWTAISRAPYLRALAMFPKGDCWNGGGLFTSECEYWFNDGPHMAHEVMHDTKEVRRDTSYAPSDYFGGECPGVYYVRLQRDDWTLHEPTNRKAPVNFTKALGDGWTLRKLAHASSNSPEGKGCYWDDHVLENPAHSVRLEFTDWEWADVDRDRLVWVEEGKLWAGNLGETELEDQKILFDFNPMEFEEIQAPY